jgi:hypothetical protein
MCGDGPRLLNAISTASQRQKRHTVTALTAKYDLMPLLGNAGLQIGAAAFGTK